MLIVFCCLQIYRAYLASDAPVQNLTILDSEVSPAWVPSPPGSCTWDILHGCVLTLVLCVWTSIHTNIPASKEPLRDTLFRKARWVIVALLAPEVVVFTAFQEWLTAKALLGELRKLWAENLSKNELYPSSHECIFNLTYAYYATMGGFAVNIEHIHNKLKRATLTKNALILLAEEGHFVTVIPESISDKGKSNLLAKALSCLQILWAAGQAIERKAAGFPITLLEYHTLVHCFCALVMYVLWLHKPYDIQDPTIVPTDDFPDLLAFIVGSSTWPGNSGFVSTRTDSRSETLQSKICSIQDPPIFWFGNLEGNENSEEIKTIPYHPDPNDAPLEIVDPKIRNWCLRVKENSQLPLTYYSQYPVTRVFSPVCSIESVLFLSSGQALRSGLGAWSLRPTNYKKNGEQMCQMRGYQLGLSGKDVLRLDLAGNFIRKHIEDPGGNPKIRNGFLDVPQNGKEPTRTIRYFSGSDSTLHGQLVDCRIHNWAGLDELSAMLNGGSYLAILVAMILNPASYGGIHWVAIGEMFPSGVELIPWKSSCIVLLGSAAVCLVGLAIQFLLWPCLLYRLRKLSHKSFTKYEFWNSLRPRTVALSKKIEIIGIAIIGPVYIGARIFLVIESFLSLRRVPVGVYQTPNINFVNYVPHL